MYKIKLTAAAICLGLSTTAFSSFLYVGDVVGRDLNIPGFGWLGHVGIATAPRVDEIAYLVLEAMSSGPGIQQNTFDSFIGASPFWGAKWGLISRQSSSAYIVAHAIVSQYGLCPQYSYTPQWHAGQKSNSGGVLQCALFRCDTLVNYAYWMANVRLPTYDTYTTTPRGVFNSFPNYAPIKLDNSTQNFEYDSANVHSLVKDHNSFKYHFNELSLENINQLTIEDIYNTFIEKEFKFDDQEINKLLTLVKPETTNSEVKLLIYSLFVSKENKKLLSFLMNQYFFEKDKKVKNQILVSIQSIYQENSESIPSLDRESLKGFFEKVLSKKDNTKKQNQIAIMGVQQLSAKISSKDNDLIDQKLDQLYSMDAINVALSFALQNKALEKKYIPIVIKNLEKYEYPLDEPATFLKLIDLLKFKGLNVLSQDSKNKLLDYMEKTAYKLEYFDSTIIKNRPNILYYGTYIELKAMLLAKNEKEIDLYITKLLEEVKPELKEMFFNGLSKNLTLVTHSGRL